MKSNDTIEKKQLDMVLNCGDFVFVQEKKYKYNMTHGKQFVCSRYQTILTTT